MLEKFCVRIFVLGAMLLNIYQYAQAESSVKVNVSVNQNVASNINWNVGADSDITAIGISRPDSRGLALAREAAIMAAQRNLLSM